MRAAVAATGLRFKELGEQPAVMLGCLSALQRLQRQGRLSRQERLCQAAARSGQLEELKVLRADGCPWDANTCQGAARGGNLEILQWLRANSCPWDTNTCCGAAEGGHIEVLQWARANGCPWDEKGLLFIAAGKDRKAVVRALIEAGTDFNKATDNGATPLSVSTTPAFNIAQGNHAAVVKMLKGAGAV